MKEFFRCVWIVVSVVAKYLAKLVALGFCTMMMIENFVDLEKWKKGIGESEDEEEEE